MKFLHVADVHLGVKPDAGRAYSATRPAEIWESFAEVIDICEEEQADLLLIAGDLFHHQPLLGELKELNYLFAKLTQTKVVLIAGNHDYIKPSSYYLSFTWNKNVFPLFQEEMGWIEFPDIQTCVYGFSYYSKEILESRYDQAMAGRRQPYEILLAHGGDDRHIPMNKHRLSALGYDYIAGGHIHKHQEIIPQQAYYAGSLEPTDENDLGAHGYVWGEIGAQGVSSVFIPHAKREYRHLAVPVNERMTGYALKEEIGRAIRNHGIHNIYRLTLTGSHDPEILFDLEGMDPYGNVIKLTDQTHPAYDFQKLASQNEDNLLGKFIKHLQGNAPGSLEDQALYEGVQALLETRRE